MSDKPSEYKYSCEGGHPTAETPGPNNGLGRPLALNGKEKRVLLADGPMMLCEFNPKGATYFADRVCEVCETPIMTHWLIPSADQERRTAYWCDPQGHQMSTGLKI